MNILGNFKNLLEKQFEREPSLSFLRPEFKELEEWKKQARQKVTDLIAIPQNVHPIDPQVVDRTTYDGLEIETLRWKLPYGPDTEAFFLKPEGEKGPLPGVLAMHGHGTFKYFGKEKITRRGEKIHPLLEAYQKHSYGGKAWANELAKLGFGVLVPDAFAFGSRRIDFNKTPRNMLKSLPIAEENYTEGILSAQISLHQQSLYTSNSHITPPFNSYNGDLPGPKRFIPDDIINKYNLIAREHEHIIAKSLFSAGTTWPGVFVAEDTAAFEYLLSRPDIDSQRIGCGGLSGGGLRTNFLAGLDDRIKCSVTVGFMSTWKDFSFNIAHKHTWMAYVPHLARYLDFPEILGMRAPLPSLVLATTEDPLYSLPEVKEAEKKLLAIYNKANAKENFRFSYYNGPHWFNPAMQEEAFEWFKRWLK